MSTVGRSPTYAEQVGTRLRAVRRHLRLSLHAVELRSNQEFKASVLGAYERGERAISVPRLQRLARLYGVPVDHLLPADPGPTTLSEEPGAAAAVPLAGNGEPTTMAEPPAARTIDLRGGGAGRVVVDLSHLDALHPQQREVIEHYLRRIQAERGDFAPVLAIRMEDVRAMALFLDVPADELRQLLWESGVPAPA